MADGYIVVGNNGRRPPVSQPVTAANLVARVNVLNLNKTELVKSTPCNMIKFTPQKIGLTIDLCAYNKENDEYVSGLIMRTGKWEPTSTSALETLFALDPTLNLIDIGANIGVYSLLAAKWGRKAVAVEANPNNAEKLMVSAVVNKMDGRITVVNNAVSDDHSKVRMIVDKVNKGGSIIVTNKASNKSRSGIPKGREEFVADVQTLFMDDLLSVITFTKAVMKIDVEGYEAIALSKSAGLFTKVNICFVFMEWHWLVAEKKGGDQFVFDYFTSMGYKPYKQATFQEPPLTTHYTTWPFDVFWKKQSGC